MQSSSRTLDTVTGGYGVYLDEVWTLDDRRAGITVLVFGLVFLGSTLGGHEESPLAQVRGLLIDSI